MLTKMKEQTVMTISFSNTHSLRIKPLLVGMIAPFKTTNPARIRKCKMFMPHYLLVYLSSIMGKSSVVILDGGGLLISNPSGAETSSQFPSSFVEESMIRFHI